MTAGVTVSPSDSFGGSVSTSFSGAAAPGCPCRHAMSSRIFHSGLAANHSARASSFPTAASIRSAVDLILRAFRRSCR